MIRKLGMKIIEAFDNDYQKLVNSIRFKGDKIILVDNEELGMIISMNFIDYSILCR